MIIRLVFVLSYVLFTILMPYRMERVATRKVVNAKPFPDQIASVRTGEVGRRNNYLAQRCSLFIEITSFLCRSYVVLFSTFIGHGSLH